MTSTAPTPIHLAGNNAPVLDERDVLPARVVGAIPHDLRGQYLRNGPNPRTGWSSHMFDGDGMVHAIALADGSAAYRNRFVRTPLFANPGVDRMALAFDRETMRVDYAVSTANTHVVEHAGRLLALEEGGYPYELTPALDTLGPFTFGGALTTAMTAHPKTCPMTGELLFFGAGFRPPFLTYHRASATGELLESVPIDLPRAVLLHDFAITATVAVFFDSSIVFDAAGIASGGSPFVWDTQHQARLGVLRRDAPSAGVRWFDIEPSHLSHSMNAFDVDEGVLLTGARIPHADGLPALHEWCVDLSTGTVTERALDDESSEFPRVPDALVGLPHRFGYARSFVLEAEPDHHEIHRYDLVDGATRATHRLPAGHTCGEVVFVPRAVASSEDDGYLLTFAHDRATDCGYLLILDAADMGGRPLAEVHLPVRVPGGFHGSWVPAVH